MAYLLDTNVFITVQNQHNKMVFWNWLEWAIKNKIVYSIERVKVELEYEKLAKWAAARGDAFFLDVDTNTPAALKTVTEWVDSQTKYTESVKHTFYGVADYYLVAQALAGNYTVVTYEVPSSSSYKIKIPDVCCGVNVCCIKPSEMLRRENAKFTL